MADRGRYRRSAHTVTDLKYHTVWKTKYGYPVLCGETGLRLREVLGGSRYSDRAGKHSPELHPSLGKCANLPVTGEDAAILQG